MVAPVKNDCNPDSIVGPLEHTIFLGCSVASFSMSSGWNEQVAEITVQLVEDACAPPAGKDKKYWDLSFTKQNLTTADPGFTGEDVNIIGTPVYFRVADFEFSGIVQSWEKINIRDLAVGLPVKSSSNVNAYSVKIVDPRQLLENCQVIINEFAGSVQGLNNIINVYGFLESYGASDCPQYISDRDGTIFGSPAGAFGGAGVNANGMTWNGILAGAQILLSGNANIWSNGYVKFKGASSPGYGLMNQDAPGLSHYVVDLSEIPAVPVHVRMNGVSSSLLNLISEVCQTAGHDYFIELLPTAGYKIIKVRTVNRNIQHPYGSIQAFIGAHAVGSKANATGEELRNELTEQLIIGGQKKSLFDIDDVVGTFTDPEGDGDTTPKEADDMIIPYFGLNSSGNVIIPEQDAEGYWFFRADIVALNVTLAEYGYAMGADSVVISELELQAALASFDMWASFSVGATTNISQLVGLDTIFTVKNFKDILEGLGDVDKAHPREIASLNARKFLLAEESNRSEALELIYDFVKTYASEFYGRKFQVRIPRVCARVDGTSGQILTSEEPTDAGWSENEIISGLANPGLAIDFFRQEDGRITPFLGFIGAHEIDFSKLSKDEYIGDENAGGPILFDNDGNPLGKGPRIWVKAQAEDELVYIDKSTAFSPRVILSISQAVTHIDNKFFRTIHGLARALMLSDPEFERLDKKEKKHSILVQNALGVINNGVGASNLYHDIVDLAAMPYGGAVAIKSNVMTYGPWFAATATGAASVKHDSGLVPWEFNGFENLNTAGNELALQGITSMQVSEQGSVTVPGYPTVPLHAELLSASAANTYSGQGPFFSGGTNLYENRSITTKNEYSFDTFGSPGPLPYITTTVVLFIGAWGPPITGITCKVGADGAETTYTLRSYSTKFGKFARYNSERLKQIGRNQLKANQELRNFLNSRGKIGRALFLRAARAEGRIKSRPNHPIQLQQQNSPHEVFIGQLAPWNEEKYQRSIIDSNSIPGMATEFGDYGDKAFMSLDGLITPISMDGGRGKDGNGDFPQYATFDNPSCCLGHPGVVKSPSLSTAPSYNLTIDLEHLHPFANPKEKEHGLVHDFHDGLTTVGHHIDIIGREESVPEHSMIMPIQSFLDSADDNGKSKVDSDYSDDYRAFALRGPLIMQGWGYDIDGKPIPNKADEEDDAKEGKFAVDSLQDLFLDDWLRKPNTWPVGPVDLRWDRKRGVWVSPPAYGPVMATLIGDSLDGGTARLDDIKDLAGADGGEITDGTIKVNYICKDLEVCDGTKLVVQYDAGADAGLDPICPYNVLEICRGFNLLTEEVDVITGIECVTGDADEPYLVAYTKTINQVTALELSTDGNFQWNGGNAACP